MGREDFFIGLGMTDYESKAISSLSRIGSASAKEISLDSGVPQNKLYSILNNFEKKGLLSRIPSDTKKYRLINLKGFVDRTIRRRQKELDLLKGESDKIEDLADEEPAVFSLIKGQRAIMNKLAETNLKVEKEILGVQRNWKIWGEGLRAMKEAVKRGVVVKQIGVINEETWKRAKEWKEVGVKIRGYNEKFGEYPLRFSVIDNKYARITVGKPEIQDPKEYITIWTDSKALVRMLRNQFMKMWKESKAV
jgi:sugar-specific transcriptional regulator TrmB